MSLVLYNLNFEKKDRSILNELDTNYLWNQINYKYRDLFISENMKIFKIDNTYNFRPDKVAYKVYGNDFYYPIILFSNQIGTILQFRIDIIGTEIKYLKPEFLESIIE